MIKRKMSWLALLTMICGVTVVTGEVSAAGATSTKAGETTSKVQIADDINEDIATARFAVNRFWSSHWSTYFNGRYNAPTIFGGYGKGSRRPPVCGGERLGYRNAFYCSDGDYIAWDVNLMRDGYRSGDAWVYLIVAHEWGHAVQARLHRSLISRAQELQADCLAGAALYGAARDDVLRFERGDVQELSASLSRLSDDYDWTDVSDHGSPAQRIGAFNQGAKYGVRGCLPS
jgi:uncharacterized protein